VYTWFWRNLPGPVPVKLLLALLAFAVVTVLLFFVVFPWAEPLLPFSDVTVTRQP
jgi:hypothetical protein